MEQQRSSVKNLIVMVCLMLATCAMHGSYGTRRLQGVSPDFQLPLSSEDFKKLEKKIPRLENARKLKEQAQDKEFTPGKQVVYPAPKFKVSIPTENVSVRSTSGVQDLNAIVVSTPQSRLGIAYLLAKQSSIDRSLRDSGINSSSTVDSDDLNALSAQKLLNSFKEKKGLKTVTGNSSSSKKPSMSQMDLTHILSPDNFQIQVDAEKNSYTKRFLGSSLSLEDAIAQEKKKIQLIKHHANLQRFSVQDIERIRVHKEVEHWLKNTNQQFKTAVKEEHRQEQLRAKTRKEALSNDFVPRLSLQPKDSTELLSPYQPVEQKTREEILRAIVLAQDKLYEF
jgi:hypothetical protein